MQFLWSFHVTHQSNCNTQTINTTTFAAMHRVKNTLDIIENSRLIQTNCVFRQYYNIITVAITVQNIWKYFIVGFCTFLLWFFFLCFFYFNFYCTKATFVCLTVLHFFITNCLSNNHLSDSNDRWYNCRICYKWTSDLANFNIPSLYPHNSLVSKRKHAQNAITQNY